jgi:MFS family permease
LNNSFLFGVFAVSAVTNLNCGFALASFNASGILLQMQQNWTELQITITTSLGIFGLMLGALFTDKILPMGRLKTMHLANLIMIVSIVPQMFLTIPSLCIGRFLLGFGSGVCIVATSVFVAEMVPADKVSIYGTSVNLGICTGILISNVI